MPREDVTRIVDEMVDELLDGAGVREPPIDVIVIAQSHLNMALVLDQRQPQRGRAQRALGKKQIYLRPEPREERHQWTVAHEIGEHLKSEVLARLHIAPQEARAMAGESLANLFAYRLLVPTRWFAVDAKALDYDVLQLKQRYATSSHEVIAWRLLDLPASCVMTIIDNEHIHRRRSNGEPIKRALLPIEERCWKRTNETGVTHRERDGAWSVACWPVHELDWKREILRSVRDGTD